MAPRRSGRACPFSSSCFLGGFTTNFIWCLFLNFRNKTGAQYFNADAGVHDSGPALETAVEAPGEEMALQADLGPLEPKRAPMLANYLLCAVAGVTWYFQFFFYTMGESQWASTSSPVGPSTWPASSSSARSGASRSTSGAGANRRAFTLLFLSLACSSLNHHHRLRQLPRHGHTCHPLIP